MGSGIPSSDENGKSQGFSGTDLPLYLGLGVIVV